MRVLVTGGGGFVGRYLVPHLAARGHEVWAGTIDMHEEIPSAVATRRLNVTDSASMREVVAEARPDAVVHLAGISSVRRAWKTPLECLEINSLGTLRLLEAIIEVGLRPVFLSVGSAEEYGLVPEGKLPVKDKYPPQPVNPYGVTKLTQGLMAMQYGQAHGVRVIHVRAFNHLGPGQPVGFVLSDFSRQVARIEAGLQEPILRVGNLDIVRDFLDVRDVARAYALLLARQDLQSGVYQVASGKGTSLQDLLQLLLSAAAKPVQVVSDPALFRPIDVPVLVGDPTKLSSATGWQPSVQLPETVRDVLAHWRANIASEQ